MARAISTSMAPAKFERVCPYCASNRLTFLEHGNHGTLYQCDLCSRAAFQRWEPDAEVVSKTPAQESSVPPSSTRLGKPGAPK